MLKLKIITNTYLVVVMVVFAVMLKLTGEILRDFEPPLLELNYQRSAQQTKLDFRLPIPVTLISISGGGIVLLYISRGRSKKRKKRNRP